MNFFTILMRYANSYVSWPKSNGVVEGKGGQQKYINSHRISKADGVVGPIATHGGNKTNTVQTNTVQTNTVQTNTVQTNNIQHQPKRPKRPPRPQRQILSMYSKQYNIDSNKAYVWGKGLMIIFCLSFLMTKASSSPASPPVAATLISPDQSIIKTSASAPVMVNVNKSRQEEILKQRARIEEEKRKATQNRVANNSLAVVSVANVSEPSNNTVQYLPSLLKNEELPASVRQWTDWIRHDSAMQLSCPAHNDLARNECIFPAILSLSDEGDQGLKFILRGESFMSGVIYPLPGGDLWQIKNVLINSKPAKIIKRDWTSKIILEKGAFEISGVLSPLSVLAYDRLQIPPFLVQVNNLSTRPVLANHGDIPINAPAASEAPAASQSTIRIFRFLRPGTPWLMSLRIEVNHSGGSKEESIGKLLPEGFSLLSFNSVLPVSYRDGQYWVRLQSGKNWINMESYALKSPEVIETRGISTAKEDWWALQLQTNDEAWKVDEAKPIDVARIGVPAEFSGKSFYDVPAKLKISRESRGIRNEKTILNISRTSWLEPHHQQWVHREEIQSGRIFGRLNTQEGMKIESFQSNGNYYPLSFDEKNKSLSGVMLTNDIGGSVGRLVSPENEKIPVKSWQADEVKINQWNINLPPRWRLLWVSGASAEESWVGTWSLYDFFILFVVVLMVARLFNIVFAGVAFLSMIMFHTQDILAIEFWWVIVASLVILKVLNQGKIRQFLIAVSSVFSVLFVISWAGFLFKEVRYWVNPSLEQNHPQYHLYLYSKLGVASESGGSSAVNSPMAGNSSRQSSDIPAAPQVMSSDALENMKNMVSPIKKMPVANASVGRGFPAWQNSYNITVPVGSSAAVSLHTVSPFWVNAVSFMQVIILTILMGWTGRYLLLMMGHQEWLNERLKKFPLWLSFVFLGKTKELDTHQLSSTVEGTK